jgi:DNA-binding beta-propeller fold protein YncE
MRRSIALLAFAFALSLHAERVVRLDAFNDTAVVFDTVTKTSTRHTTASTPVASAFVGDQLYVLARDARVLQHIGVRDVPLSQDPAFLGVSGSKLYVYSRTSGVLEEIENDRVVRRASIPRFASDLEIAGTTAYLAYPRDARIRVIDLKTLKVRGEVSVGAVPVDIAIAGGGTALTARILAVADPSAKRVWLTEETQSTTKAVARGFLRGFLGLGLFGNRSSQFPTGVDRVWIRGKHWIAYDTSSGTLYSFTKKTSRVLARNVTLDDFFLTDEGVTMRNGMSVAQTTGRESN